MDLKWDEAKFTILSEKTGEGTMQVGNTTIKVEQYRDSKRARHRFYIDGKPSDSVTKIEGLPNQAVAKQLKELLAERINKAAEDTEQGAVEGRIRHQLEQQWEQRQQQREAVLRQKLTEEHLVQQQKAVLDAVIEVHRDQLKRLHDVKGVTCLYFVTLLYDDLQSRNVKLQALECACEADPDFPGLAWASVRERLQDLQDLLQAQYGGSSSLVSYLEVYDEHATGIMASTRTSLSECMETITGLVHDALKQVESRDADSVVAAYAAVRQQLNVRLPYVLRQRMRPFSGSDRSLQDIVKDAQHVTKVVSPDKAPAACSMKDALHSVSQAWLALYEALKQVV